MSEPHATPYRAAEVWADWDGRGVETPKNHRAEIVPVPHGDFRVICRTCGWTMVVGTNTNAIAAQMAHEEYGDG